MKFLQISDQGFPNRAPVLYTNSHKTPFYLKASFSKNSGSNAMKRYGSLAQARKSLARQLIILVISVLLVFTAVRLMTGNRFDTALPIYYSSVDLDASDLVLKWEQDSIPVADYRTGIEADGPAAGTFLYLSLLPEEPGVYRLLVQDRKGYDLAEETFHVGRYLTTFAEVSGNFTGDKGFFGSITFSV